MLKQRILTALVLAPVALASLFLLPPLGFAIFVGLVITIGGWEWGGFAGLSAAGRYAYGALIAALLVGAYFLPPIYLLVAGALWWIAAFVLMIQYPAGREVWSSPVRISVIGLLVLVPGFVALLALKRTSEPDFLILLLFVLIWAADIGAYFSGRALGKHKLAPAVSPGKSWEGFYGGLILAFGIGVGMSLWHGSLELLTPLGLGFLLTLVLVIVVSVLGDLAMSMFKRNRGIKDSSNLLPGHGGILDRVDSLLSAAPVFALMITLFGWY